MVRLSAIAPVLLATTALTPRNSVVAPLVTGDRVEIDGVSHHGVPASAELWLPPGGRASAPSGRRLGRVRSTRGSQAV